MSGPILFEASKARGATLVAQLSEFKGYRFLDIRDWIANDGEAAPTRKGVTVPLDAIEPLARALMAAAPEIRSYGDSSGS